MSKFEVCMTAQERHEIMSPVKGVFEVAQVGKKSARLLAKLEKLGAIQKRSEPRVTFTAHRIDTDDVFMRLLESRAELMRSFRAYGNTLLIGSEEFAQLMRSPKIRQTIDFRASGEVIDTNGHRSVMGFDVKVIPYMQGMVII